MTATHGQGERLDLRGSAAKHGERSGYAAGCRCARCKRGWADYVKEYRRKKSPAPVAPGAREAEALEGQIEKAVSEGRDVETTVKLSPLAAKLLAKAQASSGLKRSEIIDALLREYHSTIVQ